MLEQGVKEADLQPIAPPATAAPRPRTYVPPAADPFKPYEPYKSSPGTSVFGPDGRKKRQGLSRRAGRS